MTFERLNAYQSANAPLVAWFEDASQRVGSALRRSHRGCQGDCLRSRRRASCRRFRGRTIAGREGRHRNGRRYALRQHRHQCGRPVVGARTATAINAQYRIVRSTASLNGSGEQNTVRSVLMFMSALDFDDAFKSRIIVRARGRSAGGLHRSRTPASIFSTAWRS